MGFGKDGYFLFGWMQKCRSSISELYGFRCPLRIFEHVHQFGRVLEETSI